MQYYDQMFLVGSIIVGVALLALSMYMSARDWFASGVMTLMILSVIAVVVFSPRITLITVAIVIVVILGGVTFWSRRMQRVREIRAAKDAQAKDSRH